MELGIGGGAMNPSGIDANESVAHRSSGALPLNYLQRYGLAVVSVGVALGISLLLEHFAFRVPSALLLLFAVAISSWYAGAGPALLAATLSTISFYWYFVEPVHTIYIYRSQIPYFVIFTAFAALLSRFGTFRQRAEADLRRTHDQLKVERPKLGSRTIALLYFAFSSCWIIFTDRLVHGLGLSNAYLLKVSEAKGILFISLSTLLMYVLVERALRQRHSVATAYWQLVETAQEGVWSVDVEGKTIFANENMAAILGTSPEEMIGKSILPFVPQEKKDELLNHLLQREQGLQEHYEFPFLRADGAQVWTLLRVSPVLRDGQHSGCLALVSDITKGKRAEEELHESETRFRTFVDHAGDALFVQDLGQGTIVDVNREACESLGCTRQELIGETPLAFHLDSDRAKMESATERAATGETVFDRHSHRRKDGSTFPVEVHTSLFSYGGRRFLLKVARDISDRVRAEEKLRQDEMELRQIVDAVPQHIFVLEPDGRFRYANRRDLEYTGLTLEDVLAPDHLAKILHPDDLERLRRESEQVIAQGIPWESEARLLGKEGQYRWFLIRLNPLRDEQGRIIRWYGTRTDIEDRKQAEDGLQTALDEVKKLRDQLYNENIALREEIDKASMFEEIVGTSPALQSVLSRVAKVAPTDSTVLITGETGTGKELIARAIHRRSRRSSRAFVSVNCAAIPRDLIASELFGHEKGAFTGATQQRLGRFELAGGGTIFLDEVGELPAETQIALLRVLQEHEFERVGGTRSIHADVRVIAATNRDLQAAIAAGTFRDDLFYRLNVFPIEIPPLRERKEDILLLVEYFIDRYARKAGKSIRGVNKRTLALFQSYPWPGNIRELQNVIERSVIVCETEVFSVDESWLSRRPLALEAKSPLDLTEKLAAQEREMIEAALRECGGRVFGPSGAAAMLGMPRSTLESKIRTLKINKNRFKTAASGRDD